MSGKARLSGWTRVCVDVLPGVAPPFVVAEAELVEEPGLIITAHLVDTPPEQLRKGDALRVTFVPCGDLAVPQFELDRQ